MKESGESLNYKNQAAFDKKNCKNWAKSKENDKGFLKGAFV
jgi:hypothetical protein